MQEVIFFVYYKIPFSLHDQSLQQITKFDRGVLQKYPGVTCELMQRPDISSDGIEVWLETYRGVKKDISQEFITFLNKEALAQEIPAPRKTEVFTPLSN